jgi:sirohydrochlorin cobaltochelatase
MGELIIIGEYELRHHLDAGLDGLVCHTLPAAARDIALYDAAGNYRPLKTGPTLRRGWRLALSTIEQLHEALDAFYPAMLAARVAHDQGRLAITPLRDTLNRQSGMYAVTKKITDAQADALIGSYCRSEGGCPGCLKTILWPIASATPITTLPPEKLSPTFAFGIQPSAFPLLCAEACNLLIAAARETVKNPPK